LTVLGTATADEKAGAKLSSPTYKIDIEIEGVKTWALLDNGSQVTFARAELLPLIEKHNGWAPGKWKNRDCAVEAQPVGTSGQELGAELIVAVHTVVEQMGQVVVIPCFVLKSFKPIRQGMVYDCAMILGTNAMECTC